MLFQSAIPNLYTDDVARARAFYCGQLGSTQVFQYPAEGPAEHVELRLGDVTLAISHHDAVVAEGLPAPTAGHPVELVVWCDSADDAAAALAAAGTPILVAPHTHASGHRRAYAADPDGNWIALVSRGGGQ
jgi:lactoylglutathione lyase